MSGSSMKRVFVFILAAVLILSLGSCGNGRKTNNTDGPGTGGKTVFAHVNGTVLTILTAENSSAEAFYELLEKGDVTVVMHDYGSFEKVGPLGTSLPRNDEQITTGPGDVILYQGDQITIYYDTNSWNFTRLGKVQGLTQAALKAVLGSGDVTVTFSLSEQTRETEHGKVLVVFFSATGNTKKVAEKIAEITDADIYEILPAQPYSKEDLNYNDKNSRATKEQNDKNARPVIGSEKIDISGYSTVFLGFPIWWGEEPRIMDAFVEQYDLSGKTMIPFCTSGSSGIGNSGSNLEKLAKSGTWLNGRRFAGNVSESEIRAWIGDLK